MLGEVGMCTVCVSKQMDCLTSTPRIEGGIKRIESQNASSRIREAWREPFVERLVKNDGGKDSKGGCAARRNEVGVWCGFGSGAPGVGGVH